MRFVWFLSLSARGDNANITTTANDGNGGNITIDGGYIMRLINAEISTSVLGNKGNGGNINVIADILMMKHGFIQANTAANNASGGNVVINTNALIASGGNLAVGGNIPILFSGNQSNLNVIQSAAPEGLSGNIDLVSAPMDGSSFASLEPQTIDTAAFSRDMCCIGAGSSLVRMTRTNDNFSSTALRRLRVNTKLINNSLASNREM